MGGRNQVQGETIVIYCAMLPGGMLKIGTSEDIKQRIERLQYLHGKPVILLRVMQGSYKEGGEIKAQFAKHRFPKTELFRPVPEIFEFMGVEPPDLATHKITKIGRHVQFLPDTFRQIAELSRLWCDPDDLKTTRFAAVIARAIEQAFEAQGLTLKPMENEKAKADDTEIMHRFEGHLRRATDTAIAYPNLLDPPPRRRHEDLLLIKATGGPTKKPHPVSRTGLSFRSRDSRTSMLLRQREADTAKPAASLSRGFGIVYPYAPDSSRKLEWVPLLKGWLLLGQPPRPFLSRSRFDRGRSRTGQKAVYASSPLTLACRR